MKSVNRLTGRKCSTRAVTVTEQTTADLTISGKALVTEAYTHGDQTVAADRGVKFRLAGGSDGTTYTILVSVATAGGETLELYLTQLVTDGS
jgi:hypothetical protein